jgi:hypothetical protein
MTSNGNGSTEIEHLVRAANDALTDDMVTRIAQTAADSMEFIDQVNRAGLKRALPAIADLVGNGDLDRLVRLARVYGSAEDALTDDMIGRLAEAVGEGLTTLDRFNRGGAGRIVGMLERMEASGRLQHFTEMLPRLLDRLGQIENLLLALERAESEAARAAPAKGGLLGIVNLLANADNQEALRHLLNIGKALGRAGKSDA